MPKLNPLLRFGLIAIVLYSLLMVPWPGLDRAYSNLFNRTGNALFSNFGKDGVARYTFVEKGSNIVRLNLGKRTGQSQINLYDAQTIDPRYVGYLFMALLISLIIASPVSLKRKGIALLIGLLVFQAFLAFKMMLLMYSRFNLETNYKIFSFSPFWKTFFDTSVTLLVETVGPSLFITAFLWIVVTFRKQDWNRIKEMMSGNSLE